MSSTTSHNAGIILVEDGKNKWYINVAEIMFAKADRNYTYICLRTDKPRVCSIQLGQLMKKIDEVTTFEASNLIRVGRSLIVNTRYIGHIDLKKNILVLDNEARTEITCSKRAIKDLFSSLKGKKKSLLKQQSIIYTLEADTYDDLSDDILDIDGVLCVNLNLPSGRKWAIENLECTFHSYPKQFAWGEIVDKKVSTVDNYKFGKSESLHKYTTKDGLTELQLKDDAATEILGEKWRTPTKEDFEELIEHCDWAWCVWDIYYGALVTGPNGNSIFLPASGYTGDVMEIHYNQQGYYWTSSLTEWDEKYAYRCAFYQGVDGEDVSFNDDDAQRYFAYSIRPVTD